VTAPDPYRSAPLTVRFATDVVQLPGFFQMPCVACEITGQDGQATGVVTATSGLGLASCADHAEVTVRVLGALGTYDWPGCAPRSCRPDSPASRSTTAARGRASSTAPSPGSGGRDRSRSTADVMFGRLTR
jgi:hypothetical protein